MAEDFLTVPPDVARSMDGLEVLSQIKDGLLPPPPMGVLLDFSIETIAEGRVVFAATPGQQHYNPLGTVHGGYAATLLDSCMGCAVHSTLKAGFLYTTLEFKVNLVRPMTAETGKVLAEGVIVHPGRRVATAEGTIKDSSGRLYAHASTTCLVLEV